MFGAQGTGRTGGGGGRGNGIAGAVQPLIPYIGGELVTCLSPVAGGWRGGHVTLVVPGCLAVPSFRFVVLELDSPPGPLGASSVY